MESKPLELPPEWLIRIDSDAQQQFPLTNQERERAGYKIGAKGRAQWLYTCQTNYAALQAKCERYERALRDIEQPVAYLIRKAESEGASVDGHAAIQLAGNAYFLQSIANEALSAGEGKKENLPEPGKWNDYLRDKKFNQKEDQQ